MEKNMTKAQAIKTYFQREDAIAPQGGREVTLSELKALGSEGLVELGHLCAQELGVELKTKAVAA